MKSILATISTISQIVDAVATKKSYDIAFPNLGIFIQNLQNNIKIGNFTIAFYGIIIAIGMLVAFFIVISLAKKRKINEDYFYDLFIIVIILGIVGARAYYVIFNWDYYQIRPHEILDIRAGGLAVFGGIIACVIGVAVYCKIKKCNFIELVDLSVVGLTIGQAIGRYGNFFNMEAYGTYTNNIFAMRMNKSYLDSSCIDFEQLLNVIEENGTQYIQAHPTFFYESTLNIILFIILLFIFHKCYKFIGQLFGTYLIGYGIIRYFVESLRTDSLMLGKFKISQVVAIICIIIGLFIYLVNLLYNKTNKLDNKTNKRDKTSKAIIFNDKNGSNNLKEMNSISFGPDIESITGNNKLKGSKKQNDKVDNFVNFGPDLSKIIDDNNKDSKKSESKKVVKKVINKKANEENVANKKNNNNVLNEKKNTKKESEKEELKTKQVKKLSTKTIKTKSENTKNVKAISKKTVKSEEPKAEKQKQQKNKKGV